jgi:hypothetical protein
MGRVFRAASTSSSIGITMTATCIRKRPSTPTTIVVHPGIASEVANRIAMATAIPISDIAATTRAPTRIRTDTNEYDVNVNRHCTQPMGDKRGPIHPRSAEVAASTRGWYREAAYAGAQNRRR